MYNIFEQVYNACNHDIALYSNPNDYRMNRKGQFFLVNKDVVPTTILQQAPLSIQGSIAQTNFDNSLFFPASTSTHVDMPTESVKNFDVIVVSSTYASFALQCCSPDYVDRLYVSVPLYDDNPDSVDTIPKKIGVVGFQKVWLFTPIDYTYWIRSGLRPSRISAKICVEYFEKFSNTISVQTQLHNLKSYLDGFEQ